MLLPVPRVPPCCRPPSCAAPWTPPASPARTTGEAPRTHRRGRELFAPTPRAPRTCLLRPRRGAARADSCARLGARPAPTAAAHSPPHPDSADPALLKMMLKGKAMAGPAGARDNIRASWMERSGSAGQVRSGGRRAPALDSPGGPECAQRAGLLGPPDAPRTPRPTSHPCTCTPPPPRHSCTGPTACGIPRRRAPTPTATAT